jgi:hypothetical protein
MFSPPTLVGLSCIVDAAGAVCVGQRHPQQVELRNGLQRHFVAQGPVRLEGLARKDLLAG